MTKRNGPIALEIPAFCGGSFAKGRPGQALGRCEAMNAAGPVVYAARLDGGIVKMGHTARLGDRLRYLRHHAGSDSVEILAFAPGTEADEQAIHGRLSEHLARGREYYHPVPEVMAEVNALRARLGMGYLTT